MLSTGFGRNWRNSSYHALSVFFTDLFERTSLDQFIESRFQTIRITPALSTKAPVATSILEIDATLFVRSVFAVGGPETVHRFRTRCLLHECLRRHMWIDHAEEYKSPSVGGDRIKSVCLVPSHRASMRPSYGLTQGRTCRFCLCPASPVSGAVR